ncbi:MAG: hypothetical protein ABI151_00150 [Chitinophagaceae bacterium]
MEELLNLVASLSHAEKRQFNLGKSAGTAAYLYLFNLIDKQKYAGWQTIKEAFQKKYPSGSAESSAQYLYKLILQALVENKIKNDDAYKLVYSLLQVKILKERNLHADAYAEVRRNQKLAEKYLDLPILYMLKREELNFLSDSNYSGIKEKELIAKQVAAKDVLRDIKTIHEHHTLYELLKHRLNNSPQIITEDTKKELNDLVFSEIAIINSNSRQTMESKKFHLLFQSFYFIKTSDYRSALRTFYILNELYESKLINLQHPPVEYYAMLDGILDSLRMIGHYDEMEYFLNKLALLGKREYPDYFNLLIKKTIFLSRLGIASSKNEWNTALDVIKNSDPDVIRLNKLINQQKQTELLFYVSLVYYKTNQLNNAKKSLNNIILMQQVDHDSFIYRIARLFNVVMYYENDDQEFLKYEIRSYKRIFGGKTKILSLEKFVFKVVSIDPRRLSKYNNQLHWQKLQPIRDSICSNNFESGLLKYFNFLEWAESLFSSGKPPKRFAVANPGVL